jgi:hypothetical protein
VKRRRNVALSNGIQIENRLIDSAFAAILCWERLFFPCAHTMTGQRLAAINTAVRLYGCAAARFAGAYQDST